MKYLCTPYEMNLYPYLLIPSYYVLKGCRLVTKPWCNPATWASQVNWEYCTIVRIWQLSLGEIMFWFQRVWTSSILFGRMSESSMLLSQDLFHVSGKHTVASLLTKLLFIISLKNPGARFQAGYARAGVNMEIDLLFNCISREAKRRKMTRKLIFLVSLTSSLKFFYTF